MKDSKSELYNINTFKYNLIILQLKIPQFIKDLFLKKLL